MGETALFRFDAGHGAGLGHLSRCLSLAEALRRQSVGCVLIAPDDAVETRVLAAGHAAERSSADGGDDADVAATIAFAQKHRCRWIVVDSYRLTAESLGRMRDADFVIVAIDDLAREALPAHIVVNGGAQAHSLPYRSSSDGTRFLLGTAYALLRPEFWNVRARHLADQLAHVIVTVGGSDPHGTTAAILRAIDSHPVQFAITTIVGPFFEPNAQLAAHVSGCRHPISIVEAPASLAELMMNADLAVSGGGQTLYELAATGTPAIAVQLADNQAGSMAALVAAGVVVDGGPADRGVLSPGFARVFDALVANRDARVALSRAGQSMIDGRGAERVAVEMCRAA